MGRNIFDPEDRREVPQENLGGLYEDGLGTEMEYLEEEIADLEEKLRDKRRQWLHLKRKKNTL